MSSSSIFFVARRCLVRDHVNSLIFVRTCRSMTRNHVGRNKIRKQNYTKSISPFSQKVEDTITTDEPLSLDTQKSDESHAQNSKKKQIHDDRKNKKKTPLSDLMELDELKSIASRKALPLSLANMFRYASADPSQRLRNAQFLHQELPTRIAHRTIDLLTLPLGLNRTRQVNNIARQYITYLQQLTSFPMPENDEEERAFTELLSRFVMDRTSIPMAIAAAVSSLKDKRREALDDRRLQNMEEALYRFFTSRVGLRFLTEHHILSQRNSNSETLRERQGTIGEFPFLGCIQKDCDPVLEVQRVSASVRDQCFESFGVAPVIEVVDCTRQKYKDRTFTYVPHHLQYMLAELLKNSCRATVKRHLDGANLQESTIQTTFSDQQLSSSISDRKQSSPDEEEGKNTLFPIKVVVVKGAEDVTIKIADRGGGVPRSEMDKIWTFAHSTLDKAQKYKETTKFATDEFTGGKIRGFGLPLARIYARYFGGELTLKSMEGYGLDAYIYLPVLGVACENLPEQVNLSPGNLDSTVATLSLDGLDNVDDRNDAFPAALSHESLEKISKKAL